MSIEAEIRAEMARQKIAQSELARRTGRHRVTVCRNLADMENVSIGGVRDYAHALGLTLEELLGRAECADRERGVA